MIARQRPGTAKGFVFLSLEDETGIANAIVTPQLFERDYLTVVRESFLIVEGRLQNQDNAISVKAQRVRHYPLPAPKPLPTIFTSTLGAIHNVQSQLPAIAIGGLR